MNIRVRMDYRTIFLHVCLLMVLVPTSDGASPSCNGIDARCPCLRFTYKMLTNNSKCFQFYYGVKTWKEAKDYCSQQGGRLVMLNDPATFQFIRSSLNSMSWNTNDIWIGAHDMVNELKWVWTNKRGESDVDMTWSYWSPEHPGDWFHSYKDCVVMKKDDGRWRWHEAMCHAFTHEYRFICEYDMKATITDAPSNPNVVGGIFQSSSSVSSVPSTTYPTTTSERHGTIRHHNSHGDGPRGDNRKVTDMDLDMAIIKGMSNQESEIADSSDGQIGHVPVYVVVIAFVCGTVFALGVVLFIVFRRRKRRKANDRNYPSVEYHSHPTADTDLPNNQCATAGAVGMAPVCGATGKLCKVAVDMGAEACSCPTTEDRCRDHPSRRIATPNVYVSVGDADRLPERHRGAFNTITRSSSDVPLSMSRIDSPGDSSIFESSDNLNEAPPTYDEAVANIIHDDITTTSDQEGDCADMNQEQSLIEVSQRSSGGGAIPKTPQKSFTTDYVPMNGSKSNSPRASTRSSHGSDASIARSVDSDSKDTSQYLPMSLGELPPIPTDHGYEIPVSRRPNPEAVRQARSSMSTRPESIASEQTSVYSEIPDRVSSAFYKDDEEIYSTID